MTGYRLASGEVTIPVPGSSLEQLPDGAEPLDLAGEGRVISFSVVHVAGPQFRAKAPYTLAVVELDEGARLMGLVDGATDGDLAIDARVRWTAADDYGHHFVLAG